MDDFLDSWIDVKEMLPALGKEPYFVIANQLDELVSRLRESGFEVAEMNLSASRDEDDFVAQLGRAIGAPSYFGDNWDALREVLGDRASDGPWKIAIIVLGVRGFAQRNLHDFSAIVSALRQISRDMSYADDPAGQLEIFYIDE